MRSPRYLIRLLLLLVLLAASVAARAANTRAATADDLVATAEDALARGDVQDAISGLSRAAELRPDWTAPHALLALVYQEANREPEALAEYRAVQEASWPAATKLVSQPTPEIREPAIDDGKGKDPLPQPKRNAPLPQPRSEDGKERGSRAEIITAEARLMWLVNKERAERHLELLRPVAILGIVGRQHSEEMRDLKYWSHHSPVPGNDTAMDRFNRVCGFKPRCVAENLARRWGTDYCFSLENVERSHADLMESEGHRENILRECVTNLGVGIAVDARGAYWITEVFAQCGAAALEGHRVTATLHPR